MPALSQLLPLETSLEALARKQVLPTALSSADMRAQFSAEWHRMHSTSARTLLTDLLHAYKAKAGKIISPETVRREDGSLKTEGLDVPTARLEIKELQKSLGMEQGDGSITDLTSDKRINLKLQTDIDVVRNTGNFIRGQDAGVLDAFPAQEFLRIEERDKKRDWRSRWMLAATLARDAKAILVLEKTGRMMARKDSGIWDQLGNRDVFDDALGNPFPPFAFNSGMDVRDIAYTEASALGLIQAGEAVRPTLPPDLAELLKAA